MWGLDILAGRVPYRDFDVYVAPPLAYLYGASFGLFGSAVLVDRLLLLLPMLLGTVLLAVIARQLLSPAWAAAVALLWGVWLPAFVGYGAYHFWGPALVLAMAAALLRPRFNAVLAGLAGAAALAFYQAMLPAVLAGLVVAYLTRRCWRDALAMAAGPVVVALFLLAYLLVTGTFGAFLDQTLGFTFGRYQDFNREPFPWNPLLLGDSLNWHSGFAAYWEFPMFWLLAIVAPFVIAGYALVATLRVAVRRAVLTPAVAVAVVSTGLFATAFVAHIGGPVAWLSAPLVLVLMAARLRRITDFPSGGRRWATRAPAGLLLLAGLSPLPSGYWLSCLSNPAGPLVNVSTLAGSICLRPTEAAQLDTVEKAVPGLRGAGEVAFLPTSPGLYQLTASRPPIPSYWVLPRHTRPSELAWTEAAILQRVGSIVYVADPELDTGHPWPFDEFLAAHFRRTEASPGVTVFERNRG